MTRRGRLLGGLIFSALMLAIGMGGIVTAAMPANFHAHLNADNEIPPVDSKATGEAIFKLNNAGDMLSYKLIVANIEGVTQSHIHCGGPDVNGLPVAFLFGAESDGVSVNGVLAQGTITADDVILRPDSDACPGGVASFDDLVAKLMSGDAYVNVHTLENPGGEIRGQNR